jgi:hypothetical protein
MPRATRKTANIPEGETKAAKFIRLANPRFKRAVACLRSLGKLGSSGYERTPAQVAKLVEMLGAEVKDMGEKLSPSTAAGGKASMPDVL